MCKTCVNTLKYSPLTNEEDEVCVDHFSHILHQGVDVHAFPDGWEHIHSVEGGTLQLLFNGFVMGSLHGESTTESALVEFIYIEHFTNASCTHAYTHSQPAQGECSMAGGVHMT